MSTADIFGDDDSSDDSEGEKKETAPTAPKDVEMKDADTKDAEMKEADDTNKEEKKKPALFGDSDDDSDDDDKATNEKSKNDDTKEKEKDTFVGDEVSDDSDANEKKGGGDAKEKEDKTALEDSDDDEEVGKSPRKDEAKKAGGDDDDLADSDEDDVEFDGTGAVTGTSHSKGFKKKVSNRKSALDTLREAEEAEEAAARADIAEAAPQKPAPPKVDPRTLVVLEPERPLSSTTLHITKLPNLLGIQQEAFDPNTYSADQEEEEYKGFVHDMIRWRYKKDKNGTMMRDDEGNLLRESNTRLVQWEDGSYTLHVGKEALAMDTTDSSRTVGTVDVLTGRTASFAGLNGYLYLSQNANFRERKNDGEDEGEEGADKEAGFQETAAGTVLECMGAVGSRFTARPSSVHSEAHKSLTVAVRKKNIKRAQIAEYVTQLDPEKEKEERIKHKDGIAKEKKRRNRKYGDDDYRRASRPRPGMNRSYLEDDGNFDSTDLRAIRKRTMNPDDEADEYDEFVDYGDDDDDEDEATFNRKRPSKKAKNRLDDSDDSDEEPAAVTGKGGEATADDDDDDDDEDDEVITPVKSSKKRPHQAVFDDDSD